MKTPHKLTFQQVKTGYILSIEARHLSRHTIEDYQNTFNRFTPFIGGDTAFENITSQDVQRFLASVTGVTNSTLRHYYASLAAMWSWAVKEALVPENIIHKLDAPKPEEREILPFTEAEFKAMLSVVSRSKAYDRPGMRRSDHATMHPERSRAILLLLLDTGMRVGELTSAKIHQVDRRNHRIQILGKGSKERSLPFSPRTAQALWRYLSTRPESEPDEPLFVTYNKREIDPTQLGKSLKTLGKRAGVENVHPHRFRHTFAIQYLRNSGDPYTLQRLLGHSTLEMVKRYLSLAQMDIDKAHKRASPVDNWAL